MSEEKNWRIGRSFLCAISIAVCFSLTACSTISPRYPVPIRASTIPEASKQLSDSIVLLEQDYREKSIIRGVSNIGAFVGAGGAAVSTLFKGSRDLTLALATLGAASYAIGSVYSNQAVLDVLGNGIDALACISLHSGAVVDAHNRLKLQATELASVRNVVTNYSAPSGVPPNQEFRRTEAISRASAAELQAQLRFASESDAAGQISGAILQVFEAVNKQIRASTPDGAAVMRAGSGIGSAGLSGLSPGQAQALVTPAAVPASVKGLIAGGSPPRDTVLDTHIDSLDAVTAAVVATLEKPTPPIASDTCKLSDAPATPAMTTNAPGSVDLAYGDTSLTYRVSGGNGSYVAQWVGAEPPDLMAAMQGDTLRIFVKPGLSLSSFVPGKTYQLDVYDLTPGTPKHLANPIAVNTK